VIAMEMDNVEPRHVLKDHFHEPDVVGQGVAAACVVPQGLAARRDESRAGLRVATGEQRHLVSLAHHFFGQERNDAFRTTV